MGTGKQLCRPPAQGAARKVSRFAQGNVGPRKAPRKAGLFDGSRFEVGRHSGSPAGFRASRKRRNRGARVARGARDRCLGSRGRDPRARDVVRRLRGFRGLNPIDLGMSI